jgi:hypothetical protein
MGRGRFFTSPRLRGEVAPTPPYPPPQAGRVGWGRVRGPLRESELAERLPLPDPLHSPSQTKGRSRPSSTGCCVNALMASGEREQSVARRDDSVSSERALAGDKDSASATWASDGGGARHVLPFKMASAILTLGGGAQLEAGNT